MIRTNEDLEGFLGRLERRFEKAPDGTYIVSMGGGQAARRDAPGSSGARARGQHRQGALLQRLPEQLATLYRRLLEFNADGLLHAAYGLQG